MPDIAAKDQYLTCLSCRNRFLYTAGEQRRRHQQGLPAPAVCAACRALEHLTRRRNGRLDWYSRQRGYGFIREEDGSSLFVHASELAALGRTRPRPGMPLSYYVQMTERGPRAVHVEPVPEPE